MSPLAEAIDHIVSTWAASFAWHIDPGLAGGISASAYAAADGWRVWQPLIVVLLAVLILALLRLVTALWGGD